MKQVVRVIIVLLLSVTIMAGTAPKAEAYPLQGAVEAVVNAPDTIYHTVVDPVVGAVVWTVDKVMSACEEFVVCDWSKDRIIELTNWMNDACISFALCNWTGKALERATNFAMDLCKGTLCEDALVWMDNHPGWTLLIIIGITVVTGGEDLVVIEGASGPLATEAVASETFMAGRAQYLYKLYDNEGRLLYVGITSDTDVRFAQHAASKEWWDKVAVRSVEEITDREAVKTAEKTAIETLHPCYNVLMNKYPNCVGIK